MAILSQGNRQDHHNHHAHSLEHHVPPNATLGISLPFLSAAQGYWLDCLLVLKGEQLVSFIASRFAVGGPPEPPGQNRGVKCI